MSIEFYLHKTVVDLQRSLIKVAQDLEANSTNIGFEDRKVLLKAAAICRKAKQDLDCINVKREV